MKNTLIISDTHLPFEKEGYLEFCKRIEKRFDCTRVVHIGDLVDNHAISYHEHDPDGWSPAQEMKEVDKQLQKWYKAFPEVYLCRGNHDCYSSDTEILTTNGWKYGVNLNEDDIVATLNLDTNIIEYQKPYLLIKKNYNGEMFKFEGQHSINMLVTPSHRMVISSKDTLISDPKYHIKKAHELNKAYRYWAVSGDNDNKDYDIDDDEIRLLAWVMTDGYIKDKGYAVCQSKVKNLKNIENIIRTTCGSFRKKSRNRNIESICGRKLKNPPLEQNEYYFTSRFLDNALNNNKYIIPSFAWLFSKRQFKIFIDTVIDGDGSDYSELRESNTKALILHGTKNFLDQIQSLCVQNKYHASLRIVRNKDYRLNIVPDRIKVGHTSGSDVCDYEGVVWCASVDNGTLVVRRNGNVSIQGNCLVDRKGKTVGLPSRCFKSFRTMWNLPKGWKDDFSFIFDNVCYQHSGSGGRYGHINTALNNRMSTVIGHLHSVAGVEYSANEREVIFGMCVGCGLDRHKYAFDYGRQFKNKPILGCGVVSNTKHGINAQFIPMEMK